MVIFEYFAIMDSQNRLRNSLIRRIQRLSKRKLQELNEFLSGVEQEMNSKDSTLKLAGSWKDIDDELFRELTSNLHQNRATDRQIP
jgi:hypothetical protein